MLTQPLVLTYAVELMDADDWLDTIEIKIDIAKCDDFQKVLYTADQVQEQTKD